MSRLKKTLFTLVLGDAALVLFLTFGSVFPSRLEVTAPGSAMPEQYYDYSAKSSPFEVPREERHVAPAPMPKISARSMPLVAASEVRPAEMDSLERKRTL